VCYPSSGSVFVPVNCVLWFGDCLRRSCFRSGVCADFITGTIEFGEKEVQQKLSLPLIRRDYLERCHRTFRSRIVARPNSFLVSGSMEKPTAMTKKGNGRQGRCCPILFQLRDCYQLRLHKAQIQL